MALTRDHPYAGTFTGKGETMERMARMAQEGVVWVEFDIHDVVGNDEHVVALIDAHDHEGTRRSARGPQVQVMHVHDGKMTEFWGSTRTRPRSTPLLNS